MNFLSKNGDRESSRLSNRNLTMQIQRPRITVLHVNSGSSDTLICSSWLSLKHYRKTGRRCKSLTCQISLLCSKLSHICTGRRSLWSRWDNATGACGRSSSNRDARHPRKALIAPSTNKHCKRNCLMTNQFTSWRIKPWTACYVCEWARSSRKVSKVFLYSRSSTKCAPYQRSTSSGANCLWKQLKSHFWTSYRQVCKLSSHWWVWSTKLCRSTPATV